jgi:two-component system cell cycle sensor histidine kinase/response regulator CckA
MRRAPPPSDASLDAFFHATPAALALFDRELRLVRGNDRAARLLGLPLDELRDRSLRELIPARAHGLAPLLARVLATGEPVSSHRINGADGPVWIVSAFPLPAGGRNAAAVGVVAVEQRPGEEPLAEGAWWRSEGELRAFVEQAPYGIYYSTLDGRFLHANPALVAMLGYDSEAELRQLSLPHDVYVDPRQRERLVAEYQRAAGIRGLEVEWRRRDGRRILVRLSGRPLRDERDTLTGFAMIAEDVTESRRMSRALAQAQKMEAIGQLTSGIAHDFNNLLTVILAHAKLIGDEIPASLLEAQSDLTELRKAARQGAELVHKVLALGRNETLEPRAFDLAPVAEDATDMLRRILPPTIQVETGTEPVVVQADPGAVQQILLNLATNSRDAMPAGGRLRVAVRRACLTEEDRRRHEWIVPGSYGCLEVADTGTGMAADTLAHVFEPFFTTKPVGVGTGLGLSMVYGLVKQQGGFVLLDSTPGKGTTARIYLPLAEGMTP